MPEIPGIPKGSYAAAGVFYGVVAVGLIILADYVPWIVNGLLAVILLGLILRHSQAFSGAISGGVAAATRK